MRRFSLYLAPIIFVGAVHDRAQAASDSHTDTLKQYYRDYHLMDDHELRGELTLVWFTTVGGAYYNLKEQISPNCSNTSAAAADLWQELPTLEHTTPLVAGALSAAAAEIRTIAGRTLPHPMEVICQQLETSLRKNATLYAKFLRLKQYGVTGTDHKMSPEAAAAAGHYEMANTSSLEYVNAFYIFWLSIPRTGQIVAHGAFANYVASANNCSAEHRLAKSIVELAKSEQLRESVHNLYAKVRHDVVQAVLDKVALEEQEGRKAPVFQLVREFVIAKLQREFGTHPKLGVELQKLANEYESDACNQAT